MYKLSIFLSLVLLLPAAALAAGPSITLSVKPDCANASAPKIVGSTVRVTLSSLTLDYYVRQKNAQGLRYFFTETQSGKVTQLDHTSSQAGMGFALPSGIYSLVAKTRSGAPAASPAQLFTIPVCAVDPNSPSGGKGSIKKDPVKEL